MKKRLYNPPMFPVTLRDYFAAKAMQSMAKDFADYSKEMDTVAQLAYAMADAMLAERQKPQP